MGRSRRGVVPEPVPYLPPDISQSGQAMREIRRNIDSTSIPHPSMPIPISGRTSLVGVLGHPVRHSLSPEMHNAALAELGLDWVYLALPTPPAELATVVRALEAMDCRGLSVTIPHKQAVAPLTAELTPLARRLGAVNTLVRRPGGGWLGTNTDVEGFVSPLRPRGRGGSASTGHGLRWGRPGGGGGPGGTGAGQDLGGGPPAGSPRDLRGGMPPLGSGPGGLAPGGGGAWASG